MFQFFLQLPQELREHIIKYIIHDERLPTHNLSDRPYEPDTRWGIYSLSGLDRVDYEPNAKMHQPNALNLLLTNQQLHNETKDCLNRGQYSCKVDAAVLHGRTVRPTFTCIPTKCRIIDTVYATIHIAGSKPPCLQNWSKRSDIFIFGPGAIMWAFWELLRDFLRVGPYPSNDKRHMRGPNDMSELTDSEYPSAIRILDLNVTDPDDPASMAAKPRSDGTFDKLCPRRPDFERDRPPRIHQIRTFFAEEIYDFLATSVLLLLGQTGYVFAEETYKRVGSIRMRMRGVLIGEIDLGELLVTLRQVNTERPPRSWVKHVKEQRLKHGLTCLEGRVERLKSSEWAEYTRNWCKRKMVDDQSTEDES